MHLLSTGIENIDDAHIKLLKLLQEISASVSASHRQAALEKAIEFTVALDAHFRDEERLMSSAAYPSINEHVEKHHLAWLSVTAFVDALEGGALPQALEDMVRDIIAYFFNVLLHDDFLMGRWHLGRTEHGDPSPPT